MNPDELADRMRQGEVFHSLRMLPGAWVVLRVDGRGFSRLTAERYEKPFDARFHEVMVRTATALLEDLQGVYAYMSPPRSGCTSSTEITDYQRTTR